MSDKQTHIAVLMGGWSSEREISLRSGEACAAALESQGFKVTRVDVGRDVASRLSELRPDICFNALHGRFGEDGCIQGLLEVLGIPYTHSGVLASALAMHKERAKDIMKLAGVAVAEAKLVTRRAALANHVMAPPYVVKPVTEGSSVGVVIVAPDAETLAFVRRMPIFAPLPAPAIDPNIGITRSLRQSPSRLSAGITSGTSAAPVIRPA